MQMDAAVISPQPVPLSLNVLENNNIFSTPKGSLLRDSPDGNAALVTETRVAHSLTDCCSLEYRACYSDTMRCGIYLTSAPKRDKKNLSRHEIFAKSCSVFGHRQKNEFQEFFLVPSREARESKRKRRRRTVSAVRQKSFTKTPDENSRRILGQLQTLRVRSYAK